MEYEINSNGHTFAVCKTYAEAQREYERLNKIYVDNKFAIKLVFNMEDI